ncbi:hypothetical protein B5K11_08870 [Rhizobium leguminosarum bv. trifolii]|uniref:competence protein CoiA n=1 Tax=Rhizobium leguminosarum TaxID=384 RepID=UPI000E2E639F|nr:competence protein CoiA family protein [Rhizobium leguminosarum]RFB95080.1 hypothetical protein B5K11_08870 [Rhizobium leguminosarum bv. trifolii]
MKFGLVEGIRQEATAGARGLCPGCSSSVIAKCGEIRLHHWAHLSTMVCDPWREQETDWHRGWKNEFPVEWQEVWHRAPSGEIHISDVKTANGAVIEFQHSPITPQERASREAFYHPMAWVVDGARLKGDLPSFCAALTDAPSAGTKLRAWLVRPGTSMIVDRWAGGSYPVFLDFGDAVFPPRWLPTTGLLWWLQYVPRLGAVATPVLRQSVVDHYRVGTPIRGLKAIAPTRRPGLTGFEAHLARKRGNRARF